jgi:hypothetical protein
MFKKFIITALVFVSATISLWANATFFLGVAEVTIKKEDADKCVAITFSNVTQLPIQVKLLNSQGEVLQENNIKARKTFTLKYHLDGLAQGEYALQFETVTVDFIQPISIHKKGISIEQEALIEQNKPVFKLENNILSINALNKKNAPIMLQITDGDGNHLLKEKTDNTITFGKRFDLNNWEKGEYTVSFRMDKKIYYFNINR